jgi:serine/threonine-protein kinase HipA
MLSALTLLRTEDSHLHRDRCSYPALAEELRRVCAQPRFDAPELFRRMIFNALISNRDDAFSPVRKKLALGSWF